MTRSAMVRVVRKRVIALMALLALVGVGVVVAAACKSSDDGSSGECVGASCADGSTPDAPDAPPPDAPSDAPPSDAGADVGLGFGTPQVACAFTKVAPNNQLVWDVALSTTGRIGFVGGVQGLPDGGSPPVDLGDGTLLKPSLGERFGGYAAELDSTCKLLWVRAVPYALKTAFDSKGNLWAASLEDATAANPSTITKLSPTGAVLLQTSFPTLTSIQGLAVDGSDNLYLGGSYGGSPSFGGAPLPAPSLGLTGAWVARFDPDGAHIWSKGFVGDVSTQVQSIAIHPSNDIVVGGAFGGNPAGGTFSIGGPTFAASTKYPYFTGFVARLSRVDGSHVWSRGWEGTHGYDEACVTPSGATYFSGTAWEPTAFGASAVSPPDGGRTWFLARLAPDAGSEWGRTFTLPAVPAEVVASVGACGGPIGEDALADLGPFTTDGLATPPEYIEHALPDGGAGWTGSAATSTRSGSLGRIAIGASRDIVWAGNAAGLSNDSDIRVVRFTR